MLQQGFSPYLFKPPRGAHQSRKYTCPLSLQPAAQELPSDQQKINALVKLTPFNPSDFDDFISWIDSEELLVTIAGSAFGYPLSRGQLQNYLALVHSHSFTIVDTERNKNIGHAEVVVSGGGTYKIDKLIIGDKANRGKGIGEKVINELLNFAFQNLNASAVELNVFDWNTGGIKCYIKCGFIMNKEGSTNFQVGPKNWTALNMTISRSDWDKKQSSHAKDSNQG